MMFLTYILQILSGSNLSFWKAFYSLHDISVFSVYHNQVRTVVERTVNVIEFRTSEYYLPKWSIKFYAYCLVFHAILGNK